MRQWELFGITDSEPTWTPRRITGDNEATPGHAGDRAVRKPAEHPGNGSTYLWSTDASLRMRAVSPAGAAYLGRDSEWCEGRELLDVFGMEGPNLAILEAHVAALSDEEGHCTLRGNLETVRCRVAPMHGDDGRVNGTFCIALPDPASEAAVRRHATVAA